MADTTALKNRIRAAVKANDNQEITGPVLQQALLDMVDELDLYPELQEAIDNEAQVRQSADTQLNNLITGIKNNIDNGYVYAGIATPSTTPVSGKVFYVAVQAGTYTNFGGTAVTEGITILKYNGASWVKEQALFTDGGVFDISAYRATGGTLATYADLTAALGTNGKNIPQSLRKGGMSVKFVQSSDNKYVQYRLMADEFTTDTTQWAIAEEGVYVENPEFVYVKTDAEGKILWAIKNDGSIYYGAGVPQQVVDYINEKIAELSLDEYEDIVVFLNDLEKGDKTLKNLLDEKVDKEEGKSLIDKDFADNMINVENPEFVRVILDNENKILEAIRANGTKLLPSGVEVNDKIDFEGNETTIIENPEFIEVKLDGAGRILWAIKNDGSIYYGAGVPQQVIDYVEQKITDLSLDEYEDIVAFLNNLEKGDKTLQTLLNEKVDKVEGKSLVDAEYAEGVHYIESPEFTEIKVDSEQRILEATYKDGTKLFPAGFRVNGVATVTTITNPEFTAVWLDSNNKIIEATRKDGTKVLPAGIETPKVDIKGTTVENKANPEYVEVKVDEESKLLEGTRTDGTKVIGGNLEVGNNLNVKGDVEVEGNVSYKNGIPQAIIDYVAANTGSGVTNIEYEDETGDMYATFDDADGVTDVYMEENGDIYAEIEE